MKYYGVEALCGHVGRGRCVRKNFGVIAENGKEAARKGREMPRVKHHVKEAILSVRELTYHDYLTIIIGNDYDPYFTAKNIQEQRLACMDMMVEDLDDYRRGSQYKKGRSKISKKAYENRYVPHDDMISEMYMWR